MGRIIRFVLWMLARLVVPLRYRIRVDGWDQVSCLKRPVLLLPNHPALIDPVLVLTTFYRTFRPRTVLYEENFSGPIRSLLLTLLRAVAVPDLQRPSKEAHLRTEDAISEVIAGLCRGESFVLWPSGRAERDGMERLGAARALAEILRAVPEVNVVLVRTRGVWGSMFSFARTGTMPDLAKCLLNGAMLLVANMFLFMPRRKVNITVERLDRNALPSLERDQVNRWFENWYNIGGSESPTYVPYHFLFGSRSYVFPPAPKLPGEVINQKAIQPQTSKVIAEILSTHLGRLIKPDEFKPESRLEGLGLDSLQRMDLVFAIEQRFGVSCDATPDTVGQVMALAEGLTGKGAQKPPSEWFRLPVRDESIRIPGETIPESFVTRALASLNDVAAADDFAGVVPYERLLIGALLMSRRFRSAPAVNIGLMLPASVAGDMMLFGIYLSNKLPVLLNWTTGPANLRHAIELTGVTHVVTSRALRDRLGMDFDIEGVQFLDVEDLQRQVGWLEKLCWLLAVRCLPGIVRTLVPSRQPDDRAVILFTSGSEKSPKAVPLTHANVMSNLRIIPGVLDLTNRDSFLGFLPLFHSFGLTATGLFPILAGIRVVHHNDPTDAAALTKKISNYRPTVLVGMPSVVGHLFDRARAGELDSLQWIVVGAEACPASLYEKVHALAPNAMLLEGYGVTECSPLISGNRRAAYRPGTVGRPLPGVEVCVMDVETQEPLPPGSMGILLVNSPGVFAGYLGDEKTPFVNHDGKRWYVTGDLAVIDTDGFIHFRGRLKRFIKAGGEMISLPALEEPFTRRYPPDETGPRVAVEGIETESGRKIVLFTTEPICLEDANVLLTESGFRGVMRLDAVRRLDQIPLLGTGKIDYQRLRSIIQQEDLHHAVRLQAGI